LIEEGKSMARITDNAITELSNVFKAFGKKVKAQSNATSKEIAARLKKEMAATRPHAARLLYGPKA
jgi:hypothetical protein